MVPKVSDTLPTRLRYCWYRLTVSRNGVPMNYGMFRQTLWVGQRAAKEMP